MFNNLKEKIKGKKKVVCNITIDSSLKIILECLKRKEKISKLSPMINEILWDWLKIHKEIFLDKELEKIRTNNDTKE